MFDIESQSIYLPPIKEADPRPPGTLNIIVGAQASGKTSIKRDLGNEVASYTTRSKRPSDKPTDYIFLQDGPDASAVEQFQQLDQRDEIIFVGGYNGNRFGTPVAEIRKVLLGETKTLSVDMAQIPILKNEFERIFTPEETDTLLARTVVILIGTSSLFDLRGRLFHREHYAEWIPAEKHRIKQKFLNRLRVDWTNYLLLRNAQDNDIVEHTAQVFDQSLDDARQKQEEHPLRPVVHMIINRNGAYDQTLEMVKRIIASRNQR